MQNKPKETTIACDLNAIDDTIRDDHIKTAEDMLKEILVTKETNTGYAFQFPNTMPMINHVVRWIANERLCCPFFTFTLTVNEEFWLELSGGNEVKAFVKTIIVDAQ